MDFLILGQQALLFLTSYIELELDLDEIVHLIESYLFILPELTAKGCNENIIRVKILL